MQETSHDREKPEVVVDISSSSHCRRTFVQGALWSSDIHRGRFAPGRSGERTISLRFGTWRRWRPKHPNERPDEGKVSKEEDQGAVDCGVHSMGLRDGPARLPGTAVRFAIPLIPN